MVYLVENMIYWACRSDSHVVCSILYVTYIFFPFAVGLGLYWFSVLVDLLWKMTKSPPKS